MRLFVAQPRHAQGGTLCIGSPGVLALPQPAAGAGRQLRRANCSGIRLFPIRLLPLLAALTFAPSLSFSNGSVDEKILGLLAGSAIGDAAGGPVEFVHPPDRCEWTGEDRVLTDAGIRALRERFRLRPYNRDQAPYAEWGDRAPAGTVTDDTRWKIILLQSVAPHGALSRPAFAQAFLRFGDTLPPEYRLINTAWQAEYRYIAEWTLDPSQGYPQARAWGGIPTMAGQMPFPAVAAFFPGRPTEAYLKTWELDFIDNGWALDLNAAIVAGLAHALEERATWESLEMVMRNTDPFAFGEVPWVERRLTRWLDRAQELAERSDRRPFRLFQLFETELEAETWWEAHVPLVVVFACARICDYDPIATIQLTIEFGHDTDSYAQLAGALVGALHGAGVFSPTMIDTVDQRLRAQYQVSFSEWLQLVKSTPSPRP